MEIIDLIDDAFFYSSRLIKTKKMESDSKKIFILIYLLIFLIYLYYLAYSYKIQSKISFSQLFIQEEDYEQSMTFGFFIDYNWTNKMIIELFDSDNNPIFNNDTCDEYLNLLTNDEVNLTQKRSFKCFINYKIKKSYTTNHQIKIHLRKNNTEMQEQRIPLIIKFKEPVVNHSLDNPFDFPNELQELVYYYDKDNVTSYRKYVKFIEYKTESLFSEETIKSHYLEDYEDSSKTIEDFNDTMIGSFRICLSKKKDIFERRYKGFFELLSDIGGFITILNIAFNILIKTFVNSLDHLRLLNSIKKENIQSNNDNNKNNNQMNNLDSTIKNEDEPNDNKYYDNTIRSSRTFSPINKNMRTIKGVDELNDNNNLDLSSISEFTDKDKEIFILSSICKFITDKILILSIIIIIAIVISVFSYFWIETLWISIGIFALPIIIPIFYYLCKKKGWCSCCCFIIHLAIIVAFIYYWSIHKCSFPIPFFNNNKLLIILLIVGIYVAIIFIVLCCKKRIYKIDNSTQFQKNQKIIDTLKTYIYINSEIDTHTLLEDEIKKKKLEKKIEGKINKVKYLNVYNEMCENRIETFGENGEKIDHKNPLYNDSFSFEVDVDTGKILKWSYTKLKAKVNVRPNVTGSYGYYGYYDKDYNCIHEEQGYVPDFLGITSSAYGIHFDKDANGFILDWKEKKIKEKIIKHLRQDLLSEFDDFN